MDCTVLGAGVSGLTSALTLLEAGHRVRVLARELPPHTTSNVAAAFWFPYGIPDEPRARAWLQVSHARFVRLAREDPTAGVRPLPAQVAWPPGAPWPWWTTATPGVREAESHERPPATARALTFDGLVVDTRSFLPWLVERVRALGGEIDRADVTDLDATPGDGPLVCCVGLGARTLLGDREVTPVRGQLLRVRDPGLREVRVDETDPCAITYVVPRGDDCILGGTCEQGDTDLTPDPATRRAIVARARRLAPELGEPEPLGDLVGLRPHRPRVRLERVTRARRTVVFNYGHGGAGVTLSWGCAAGVAELVSGAP